MKHVIRFAALVMIGTLLSGMSVFAQEESVEITVSGASGQVYQWLNEVVVPSFEAEMEEAGTPVTVNVVEFTGSGDDLRQQYALDLNAGSGADILSFDGFWLPEFVEAGLLQPLTEVVGEEALEWEGWEQTPEDIQQLLGYNGELYGIPSGTDARVIWYNSGLLTQAGLPEDWQPTSWEELLEAARAVKEALPEVTPLQINAGTNMGEATTLQGYLMLLLGAGHHVYDFEEQKWIVRSQAILDTLNLYQTIYLDEELGDARFQLVEGGRDQSFEAFANGEVAMLVEGDFFWRAVVHPEVGTFPMENRDEVVDFALMPAQTEGAGYNGQDFVTISGGTGFVLNSNTEYPQEAWAFLTYMFSAEMLEEFQAIQPRIRARQDVAVTGDDTMTAIAEEVLPLTTIRPQLPEYNRVSAEIQLMTERVVSGELSPEEAMEAYAEAVTEIVGEENTIDLTAAQ